MNILISGATGLVGTALTSHLRSQGHSIHTLQRNNSGAPFSWQPDKKQIVLDPSINIDAVINLNGVNIGDKPWSPQRKLDIIKSRVDSTSLLADTMAALPNPPKVFINASAIGFYGNSGSTAVDESSSAGTDFLTEIVSTWEKAANALETTSIRTVFIRSGVVLSKEAGALQKMLLPFKLGLGGRVGSGKQFMSWIALEDEVRAIDFILNNSNIKGPVNLTSPNAVTNKFFTKTLASCLNRPSIFPMPEFIVKLLFGEMGEMLLLGGANVKPTVLLKNGFEFKYPELDKAFQAALK
ncbi:MAG: TIGR01777 family protein [Oleispira sp.]|nr:TIGR01777 family protein [Oleispira sp.]|tara:strand:- start:108 stop:995 length:888 start_codon:yes stop_codon:yes gene_type:complete